MKKKKKHADASLPAKETKKAPWPLLLFLTGGTLLSSILYFQLVKVSYTVMKITLIAYIAVAGLSIVGYFIYNRGLVGTDVTPAMLPDTMSPAEKQAYLQDIADRKRKSRCLVALFFVFLVPLTIDLMKLFVLDPLFPNLFSGLF